MKKTTDIITKLALTALLLTATAHAEYVVDADPVTSGAQPGSVYNAIPLSGTTKSEGWTKLTSSLYPGNGSYPGLASWTGALASQVGPNAGANGLAKLANGVGGGPYPASGSIYFGGFLSIPNTFGGTLAATASGSGVLSGVKTVVFQLDIGEAWTYDLYNDVEPVLNYTSSTGSGTISADYTSCYAKVFNGQVTMNGQQEDLYINSRAYQFDVSSLGTITSFSVSFDGAQHSQVYGLGLQQSNVKEEETVLPDEAELPE